MRHDLVREEEAEDRERSDGREEYFPVRFEYDQHSERDLEEYQRICKNFNRSRNQREGLKLHGQHIVTEQLRRARDDEHQPEDDLHRGLEIFLIDVRSDPAVWERR